MVKYTDRVPYFSYFTKALLTCGTQVLNQGWLHTHTHTHTHTHPTPLKAFERFQAKLVSPKKQPLNLTVFFFFYIHALSKIQAMPSDLIRSDLSKIQAMPSKCSVGDLNLCSPSGVPWVSVPHLVGLGCK